MTNHLLAGLPRADGRRLKAGSELVALAVGQQLLERGEASAFVYFPISGAVALMGLAGGHGAVAVGLVGFEGVIGAHLLLGIAPSPLEARVLCAGEAWRISRAALRRELAHNSALRLRLSRYLIWQIDQLGRMAACLHFHQIAGRLACWLLMCNASAAAERFHVTHEVLAVMLGVRRVSVTVAAVALQRMGVIHYHRGDFTVLDAVALHRVSCACFGDAAQARQLFKLRR